MTLALLLAAYGAVAGLLVGLGGPRKAKAAGWVLPAIEPRGLVLANGRRVTTRCYPADTDNVLVLAARGPACEALASQVAAFGLARVYSVAAAGADVELPRVAEALGESGPLACGTRPEAGPLELSFVGGRYGARKLEPLDEALVTADGVQLPVRVFPAPAAPDVLVFLHGASSHGGAYDMLGQWLAASGLLEVVLPTLRGHHGAGGQAGDTPTPNRLVEDVAAVIASVKARRPGARILLGGHSTGAGLALRLANSRHAAAVDGYLLIAPYLGPFAATTPFATRGTWARPAPARVLGLTLLGPVGTRCVGHLDALLFVPPLEVCDGRETLRYSCRMLAGLTPGVDAVAKLRKPTLVLVGGRDEVFRASAYARAFEACPAARVALVPPATHLGVVFHPQAHGVVAEWLATHFAPVRQPHTVA